MDENGWMDVLFPCIFLFACLTSKNGNFLREISSEFKVLTLTVPGFPLLPVVSQGAVYQYLNLNTHTHTHTPSTWTVCTLRSGAAQTLICFLSGGKQCHKQYVNITECLCRLTHTSVLQGCVLPADGGWWTLKTCYPSPSKREHAFY